MLKYYTDYPNYRTNLVVSAKLTAYRVPFTLIIIKPCPYVNICFNSVANYYIIEYFFPVCFPIHKRNRNLFKNITINKIDLSRHHFSLF